MSDAQHPSHGTQPPTSPKGHPLPRRSSPENSITLRNHRLAHEASAKAASMRAAETTSSGSSPLHRQSSDESHNTGPSDPKNWFQQSNQNPTALYSNEVDADPPFFQRESDSSNEDNPQPTSYPTHLMPPMPGTLKPSATHSSSADDYRSVIDDLTVEIKRLKDELRRYKQKGPEMMKQDRLFEIKVHGLPKRKKRELESTLRDFASGLESSTPSAEASSARNKSRHKARLESGSGSASKHASSTSGSHSRPVDSAYASMSTGANSSGTSLARPSMSSRTKTSDQKVENYLKDIPEGLYPRHMVLTDKDKKKLVVRRLEQIFTGKISGRSVSRHQPKSSGNIASYAPIMVEPATGNTTTTHGPSNVPMGFYEPSREARILLSEEQKNILKENGSSSNSNGEQLDFGVNSVVTDTSPPDPSLPEQRPTRPLDLDPDRKQNPSANMDYIRHLGLAPPHLTGLATNEDVSPDSDGWVYLNLLSNMAQLHMLNVAPDYIRSAVSEKSAKFQLSPDGRKIRWRGGTDGTKFSSDSSGETSQTSRSEEFDAADDDEHSRKRKRRQPSKGELHLPSAGQNSSDQSKFDQKLSSADSFHYKPLFVHQSSSAEQTSLDDSNSSGAGEDSNNGVSRWGNSGSGSARRKRRRLDGAIIYYSGAPFCMDLSGDPGDMSPSSYMTSTGQEQLSSRSADVRPEPQRTESGSVLPHRPLADGKNASSVAVATEAGSDDSEMYIDADFPWSNSTQDPVTSKLDACGLGGVIPDDHFRVIVTTRRSKMSTTPSPSTLKSNDIAEVMNRIMYPLGSSSQAGLPKPKPKRRLPVTIEYISRSVEKLNPTPLPPPGMYFSFDSDTSETSDEDISDPEDEPMTMVRSFGNQVHPHTFENQYPDDADMSSGDEEDVEPDDGDEPVATMDDASSDGFDIPILPRDALRASSSSAVAAAGTVRSRSKSLSAELPVASDSSVAGAGGATADGAESGYSSSREESG